MKLSIITFVALLSCTSAFAPSAVSPRSAVKALNVKTGSAGTPMGSSGPAKSKEEDIEFRLVILCHLLISAFDNLSLFHDTQTSSTSSPQSPSKSPSKEPSTSLQPTSSPSQSPTKAPLNPTEVPTSSPSKAVSSVVYVCCVILTILKDT